MNLDHLKSAYDGVKFSSDFETRTIEKLLSVVETKQKEENMIKTTKPMRIALIAAAIIAILSISVYGLSLLLTPKEVAIKANDNTLANAFYSKDAILFNESKEAGEFTVSLLGIVSGKNLSDYCEEAEDNKSYIVTSLSYTDGREIKDYDETQFTFTPLISGYKPWQVNAWTLGGGYYSFIHEGIQYYLFECSNIEIFADHTIYLAAYQGSVPSSNIFTFKDNGEIEYNKSFDKPHTLFTIPIDPSKADPKAVKELFEASGIVIE